MIPRNNEPITSEEKLIVLSYAGNFEKVKRLIEQGVNIHTTDDLPIRMAFDRGHSHIVKYMLPFQPKVYWLTHQNEKIREMCKEYAKELRWICQ